MFITLLIFLAILSILFSETGIGFQKFVLILFLVLITFMIGARDIYTTPDAIVYKISFDQTPILSELNKYSRPLGYDEMGFYYLGSLIKTVTSNYQVYFTIYAGITMFFLYKFLGKYSIFILIGLTDYYVRFLIGRDFVQMRSALSILIVMFALQYANRKQFYKYFIMVWLAYVIHHSAFVAVPFFFINMIKLNRKMIYYGLVIAAVLAVAFAPFVNGFLMTFFAESPYMSDDAEFTGKGLGNPIIYLQVGILVIYTFKEKTLSKIVPAYYTLRTAYFYSTFILVMFCRYAIVAGRGSTMFATAELIVLPSLALAYSKKNRPLICIIIVCLLGFIQYMRMRGGENISL